MLPGHVATSSDKRARLNNYVFLRTIGEGSFAKVKLARHVRTGREVAIKVIRKDQQSSSSTNTLSREFQSLKMLSHPNIVKLLEVIDTQTTLFLVMEHVRGGDMGEYIRSHGPMTEEEARGTFRQLISALHYCHEKGIVHRDLKPENFLLDDNLNLKLSDFGLSNIFTGRKLSTDCGTLNFMAPELLQGRVYDGPPADVWSLGVVLYLMITARLPFQGGDIATVKRRVLRGQYPVPLFASPAYTRLIKRMLALDPRRRPTLRDIFQDPWVNMGQQTMKPYRERPCDKRDPWVIEHMINLGYEWDRIKDTLKGKKYDDLMATYQILMSMRRKIEGQAVPACSIPSVDPNSRTSLPPCEVQPASVRQVRSEPKVPTWFHKAREPESQEAELKAEEPASPPPSLESRTATPCSTPPRGPGAFPSTHSTSSISGAPGETNTPNAGQPSGATPTSSPGPSQGWRGAAGRFFHFIRHFCLCLPCKKTHGRRNRVKPL